nr:O-methyltransferase [Talaromyces sp.]
MAGTSNQDGISAMDPSRMEAPKASSLEILGDEVTRNVSILSKYLLQNDLPQPSFERSAPLTSIPPKSPAFVQQARQDLMDAALKLFQLASGPSEYIPNLALGYHYLACLQWLAHFKIFNKVPLEGTICYADLAKSASVSEVHLKSISRMAMTNNLFHEPEPNHVAHTATSAMFVTNPLMHDWAIFMAERSALSASKMLEASIKWPQSLAKNHTGFNIARDTDLAFFDWLDKDPKESERFAQFMKMIRSSESLGLHHLINGFDWASLGTGNVVDVGGSSGSVSIELAKAFPQLKFVVQDLPQNIESASSSLATDLPSLTDRITFQGHDFFQEQTVKNADAYLLRMILHDWQPEDCVKILRNILPAMKESSKIIIMDVVLPKPGSVPAIHEGLLRAREMTMLQNFNSTERDIDDWNKLLKDTDERLKILNLIQPVGSWMAVLEVGLQSLE